MSILFGCTGCKHFYDTKRLRDEHLAAVANTDDAAKHEALEHQKGRARTASTSVSTRAPRLSSVTRTAFFYYLLSSETVSVCYYVHFFLFW